MDSKGSPTQMSSIPYDQLSLLIQELVKDRDAAREREERLLSVIAQLTQGQPSTTAPLVPQFPMEPTPMASLALARYKYPISVSMDRRLFTFDSNGEPIYAGNFAPQEWLGMNFILNTTMFLMLSEDDRALLAKDYESNISQLLGVEPGQLRKYGVPNSNYLDVLEISTSSKISYDTLVRMLNTYRIDSFDRSNLIVTPDSLYTTTIRERVTSIPVIDYLDKTTFFNGKIIEYTYALRMEGLAGDKWQEELRSIVLKVFNTILHRHSGPTQFSLTLTFRVTLEGDDRPMEVKRVITQDLTNPLFTIDEYFEENPSDYLQEHSRRGSLDVSSFTISATSLRAAGGALDHSVIEERLKKKSTVPIILGWGTAKLVKSSGNYCFWAILADVRKDIYTKGQRMAEFSQILCTRASIARGPEGLIDFPSALAIGDLLDMRIIIYNEWGDIMASNSRAYEWYLRMESSLTLREKEDLLNYVKGVSEFPGIEGLEPDDRKSTLRLLYSYEHYFLVTSVSHLCSLAPSSSSTSSKILRSYRSDATLFYRIVGLSSSRDFGRDDILPVSVGWLLGQREWKNVGPTEGCYTTKVPSLSIVSKLLEFIHSSILSDSEHFVHSSYHVNLIAFNGSEYDHHFLLKFLILSDFVPFSSPLGRDNKVRKMSFRTNGTMINGKLVQVFLHVWDPVLFVKGTFHDTLTSFSLIPKGTPIPTGTLAQELQGYYDSFSLEDFLTKDKVALIAQDMLKYLHLLRSLCDRIEEAFRPLGMDVYQAPTLPSLVYSHWKVSLVLKSLEEKKPKGGFTDKETQCSHRVPWDGGYKWIKNGVFNARFDKVVGTGSWTREKELFVRDGVYGGRIISEPGEYLRPLVLADAVSLFPYQMLEHSFPCGNNYFVSTWDEVVTLWDQGKIKHFLFQGTFDQSSLPRNLKPHRDEGLNWEKGGKWTGKLTDFELMFLVDRGIDVQGEPPFLVWEDSKPLFNAFIASLKGIKEGEDAKKARGETWNESMRSMAKLSMNAVFGKLLQHQNGEVSHLFSSLNQLMTIVGDGKLSSPPVMLSDTKGYVMKERIKKGSMTPSWLGLWILNRANYDMYQRVYGVVIPARNLKSKVGTNGLKGTPIPIYYGDTDSLLVDEENNLDLKEESPDKQFGDLEIKERTVDAIICGPKMYYVSDSHYRLSGIKRDDRVLRIKGTEETRLMDEPRTVFSWLNEDGEVIVKSWQVTKRIRDLKVFKTLRTFRIRKGGIVEMLGSEIEEEDPEYE